MATRKAPTTLLSAALLASAVACGGDATNAVTSGSAKPDTSQKPAAKTSAAASAKPAASAPASASAPKKEEPKGPFKWEAFSGPKEQKKITTPKAWAAVPVGLDGNFGTLKIALYDFGRAEGDFNVMVRFDKVETWVPQALTHEAQPAKGVKKGDAVMADVAASSGYGRVVDVEGEKIKIKYWWVSMSEATLSPAQVVKLEDKVAFGHPVAIKGKDGFEAGGNVAYTGKDKTWIITASGAPKEVDTKDVKALKVTKPFKKGDKVWVAWLGKMDKAEVVEALEGGAAYKVKLSDGKEQSFGLDKVSAPL